MTVHHALQATPGWDTGAAAHLLSRAAFGGTPTDIQRLATLTREQAVNVLLNKALQAPSPSPPTWVREPWVNTERVWADTPPEARSENHRQTSRRYRDEIEHLRAWWVAHMLQTPGPLREMMTLFWHGHFTSAFTKVFISQAFYQQNVTLRQHALGNFRTLLGAMLLDAAMMLYLDMEDSDRGQPNENLARELCELFTLGVGNYTEQDVRQIARALTGWTLDAPPGTIKQGEDAPETFRGFRRDGLVPRFLPERHDTGVKTILGHTGVFGVHEVADMVAAHPATARFLAGKLLGFFGVSDPHGQLQGRLAETFTEQAHSATQITEVLRVLFTAPEFYAEVSRGTYIKSPVHLLVGACRQLQLEVEPTPNLVWFMGAMGQTLLDPPNVKGWPGGTAWLNAGTMAVRFHLGDVLLDSQQLAGLEPLGRGRGFALPRAQEHTARLQQSLMDYDEESRARRNALGIKCHFAPQALFPEGIPEDPGALLDALLARLLVRPARPETREALLMATAALPPDQWVRETVRLILATPEYQMA